MKRSLTILAALGLLIGFNACERQKWENTRELHLTDHGHSSDAEGHHADGESTKTDDNAKH